MKVIIPPRTVDQLARRIERAYLRRNSEVRFDSASSGVWEVAAARLIALHQEDPALPLDPELFVAAQRAGSGEGVADPWHDLTHPDAGRRFRRCVRAIVSRLRRELRLEVRRAEVKLDSGESLEAVLDSPKAKISPLGRYVVARRANRSDLADTFWMTAQDQHHSCPLYRQASRGIIPDEAYPVLEVSSSFAGRADGRLPSSAFSLN